ncbi:MAG: B12-binding domain-containing radical SAM protein [Acidobacteria bacterium]|nr:B12-binding domain-containing radical SAM protein [Acidobacteriota bacterium]
MIFFLNPRAAKPKNRRFPLSILALAAVVEGREDYAIFDGNIDPDPWESIDRASIDQARRQKPAELLAVTVMPGPQMVAAIPVCRAFRERYPAAPIVWGGYFPSLYTDAALNAKYVDFVVRGQGEETFVELLAALRGKQDFSGIRGLSYKDRFGLHVHNPERPLRSPGDFPWYPYHRLETAKYLLRTFLGSRTAVHQASIGCPFRCNFCGVVPVFDREKMEPPERTAAILGHLKQQYGADAVQFYDNNFFLREDHTAELAERLAPLEMRWWCEGRIDTVLGYSDRTWEKLRRAGSAMIFFGAESGSDEVLRQMNKNLKAEQTLALAARIRQFGIIPEFSFILGNPQDPERDTRRSIEFIRKIKRINPEAEIIVQHYIPTPQRDGMYGGIEGQIQFPATLEEWATERWYNFTTRIDPHLPWLPERIRRRIDDFELVVNSRWPTVQDIYLRRWGRSLLQSLSAWRYALGIYGFPVELEWAHKIVNLRKPRLESL